MKTDQRLRNKIGADAGFKVPDGFFEATYARISAELPERPVVKQVPLTRWQRLKPYVYLAAMFAGIWCTLKMVTMMGDAPGINNPVSLDNPPQLVAQAMASPSVADASLPVAPSMADAAIASALEDFDQPEETTEPTAEDSQQAEYLAEPMLDSYDIDLDELRAELDREDDADYYYY